MGSPLKKTKINLFEREDCEERLKKVTDFICQRFKRYSTMIDLRGVVIDVMVKISEGESKRNEPADVNPDICLYQFARSEVTHRLDRKRKAVPLNEVLHQCGPEELLAEVSYHMLTDRICEIVSGDSTLSRIVNLWIECPDIRPKEMSLKLGITPSEMRNAKKRLRRILKRKGVDQWQVKKRKR